MTRNGVRLRETQRFRVFLAFSLKNGNPFDRLSYIIYKRKTHRYLRTRTATHKAPQCFNNKTLPKQLITETAHTGVRYFLSPGLKSDILGGNYLSHRQQPPASTHILRTLRGYAEASACAVTQVLLYISEQALSSLFSQFFRIFSNYFFANPIYTPFRVFSALLKSHCSGCLQCNYNIFYSVLQYHRAGCFQKNIIQKNSPTIAGLSILFYVYGRYYLYIIYILQYINRVTGSVIQLHGSFERHPLFLRIPLPKQPVLSADADRAEFR